MRKIKKGQKGQVTNYISRSQALRKLQLSLADFRRLCILKGIYPREPRHKKKVGRGDTRPKTYYWVKDIAFLAHEPLLRKFREFKVFARKLHKAIVQHEPLVAESLRENKPAYTLDHIVRERYPTFVDALRDMDDVLCMIALFARIPSVGPFKQPVLERCVRLHREFRLIVARTRSLRKVFLSVKGIYYQVELYGQAITWIEPYEFNQKVPSNVDLKIMATFLEFYETLLGFVNFKLYHDENLAYPPVLDASKEERGAGLSALSMQALDQSASSLIGDALKRLTDSAKARPLPPLQKISQHIRQKVAKTAAKEAQKAEKEPRPDGDEDNDRDDGEEDGEDGAPKLTIDMDEFPENTANGESSSAVEAHYAQLKEKERSILSFSKLFEDCVVFVNRECPKDSIEFVVKCFGGQVGWAAGGGSPFEEAYEKITHQVIDRPNLDARSLNRVYVQPQWIYDCVNSQRLLPTQPYTVGAKLPPHLSPFVVASEDEYVPEGPGTLLEDDVREEELEGDDDEEEEEEEEEEETGERKRGHASVIVEEEEDDEEAEKKLDRKRKRQEAVASAEEQKLAAIMMPKRDRELYTRIQKTKQKRLRKKQKLTERKRALDKSARQATAANADSSAATGSGAQAHGSRKKQKTGGK